MKEPYSVILTRHITEKGTRLKELRNQFLFKVSRSANKPEIKRAVEKLFKVHVTNVRTLNVQGKKKRERTVNYGRTAAWKRAIVTLKQGETIEEA